MLGLGKMGKATAGLLVNIGFDVRGWSRTGTRINGVRVNGGHAGLEATLRDAEILVNLLPLTAETRGILSAATFSRLALGACLLNFGRSAHLVEADLFGALASGQLRRAVLDVFDQEPLPAGHPFWSHPGIAVLPHVAARTDRGATAAVVAAAVAEYRHTGRVPAGFDRNQGY